MNSILIGNDSVPRLGYGCMGLTQAYRPVGLDKAKRLLKTIVQEGSIMLDTAAAYSGGKNELLVGSALKPNRDQIFLASKAGLYRNPDGTKEIDGDPDRIIRSCEESLQRMDTDYIDLFYLHRIDDRVPVEDSVGGIKKLLDEGKVKYIGLSEVSRSTLERAMLVAPIHAVQSEYSLWSRKVEEGILQYCKQHDIALIAYSPVGRGFLAGGVRQIDLLTDNDIRQSMPRFQKNKFNKNIMTLERIELLALEWGMTLAQVCLNWLWSRGDHVGAIPGTSELPHWRDNQGAVQRLSFAQLNEIEQIVNKYPFEGSRYGKEQLLKLDSERYA